jgi:hypothetical protein
VNAAAAAAAAPAAPAVAPVVATTRSDRSVRPPSRLIAEADHTVFKAMPREAARAGSKIMTSTWAMKQKSNGVFCGLEATSKWTASTTMRIQGCACCEYDYYLSGDGVNCCVRLIRYSDGCEMFRRARYCFDVANQRRHFGASCWVQWILCISSEASQIRVFTSVGRPSVLFHGLTIS